MFGGLVKDLHARYGGRDDPGLRAELSQYVKRYFTAGLDTMVS